MVSGVVLLPCVWLHDKQQQYFHVALVNKKRVKTCSTPCTLAIINTSYQKLPFGSGKYLYLALFRKDSSMQVQIIKLYGSHTCRQQSLSILKTLLHRTPSVYISYHVLYEPGTEVYHIFPLYVILYGYERSRTAVGARS